MLGLFAPELFLDEHMGPLMDRLWGIALMLSYALSLEGLCARTLGKLVTGTMVLNADDEGQPGFGRLVFETFSFLADDASGWRDKWSSTRVVRLRPGPMHDVTED